MLLLGLFNKVLDFVKEGIAPSQCVECGHLGRWLCFNCEGKILFLKQQNCYRCRKLSEYGRTCETCRRYSSLYSVVVATYFGIGPIRSLIHGLKYNSLADLSQILGEVLVSAARYNELKDFTVVPVPLHRRREKQRSFNQAELLSRYLANKFSLPFNKSLKRVRDTSSQTKLTREQRLMNIQNAFMVNRSVVGDSILLVDDVITTGATLEECARMLKEAGAKKVVALVVARG